MLLVLPLSLIICCALIVFIDNAYLVPLLGQYKGANINVFIIFLALSPGIYIIWFTFLVCLLVLYLTHIHFHLVDFHIVLALFIATMYIWTRFISIFVPIKRMFKNIIDSTLAVGAWGLLGLFVILIILALAIFLQEFLLVTFLKNEDVLKVKLKNLKNISLCFIALMITAIGIVYL